MISGDLKRITSSISFEKLKEKIQYGGIHVDFSLSRTTVRDCRKKTKKKSVSPLLVIWLPTEIAQDLFTPLFLDPMQETLKYYKNLL